MSGLPKLDLTPFMEEYQKETPEELLSYLYYEKELTLQDIGYRFNGVSGNTVAKLMKYYGLKRRTMSQTVKMKGMKSGHIGRGDLIKENVK